jgi:hypothetical protein
LDGKKEGFDYMNFRTSCPFMNLRYNAYARAKRQKKYIKKGAARMLDKR